MEKNVQGNKVGTHVHVAELNWGDDFASGIPVKDVDVVLAADCVYFEVSAQTYHIPISTKTIFNQHHRVSKRQVQLERQIWF